MAKRKAVTTKKKRVVKKPRLQRQLAYAAPIKKVELKRIDFRIAPGARFYDAAGNLDILSGCAVGSENYQRVGRQIQFKGLQMRMQIIEYMGSNTSYDQESLRTLIVYDRSPNGATPAVTSILESVSNAAGVTTDALSMKHFNNSGRFLILKDQLNIGPAFTVTGGIIAGATGPTFDQHQKQIMEDYIDISHLNSQFLGTGVTIASISSGALFLLTIGSNAANAWALAGDIRVTYTDQ